MPSKNSLSTKLVTIGAVLLTVALLSIGLTLWVTWQLEGGAAAVNEAGRMRMQMWRLNSTAQSKHSEQAVADLVDEFSKGLALLKTGDPGRPLFMPMNDEVDARFRSVQAHWASNRGIWLGSASPDIDQALLATSQTVAAVDGLVTAIEQQLARLTAILNLFQFVMMALAIAGSVVMLYTGYQYVINPLANLQRALRSIQNGNFAARVDVDSDDEFGQVASGFNGMASELQGLYEGLEAQVKIKTEHIEAQRARLESLYEISAFSASAASIEELSRGFAKRVRVVVGADAAVVRWSDEANQRYLMLASDCFPQDMLDSERSLLAGACACGNLKFDARTRVIPIVEHEDSPMRACARAGFVNVVSVPVRLQNRLLGEIDLFFRSGVQLSPQETDLLDALASHLATLGVALEAPLTRLLNTAAEVPQAASGVIAQLRQEVSRLAERDNLALEERAGLVERISTLLQTINLAAGEQRSAIESLVASAALVLERSGSHFSETLDAQAGGARDVAAQVAASAVELSSLGESFNHGVQLFSVTNEKLMDSLQRIEGAIQQSMARSDEQLAYYVAQAREVIDLSITSQQGLVEDLRRLDSRKSAMSAGSV